MNVLVLTSWFPTNRFHERRGQEHVRQRQQQADWWGRGRILLKCLPRSKPFSVFRTDGSCSAFSHNLKKARHTGLCFGSPIGNFCCASFVGELGRRSFLQETKVNQGESGCRCTSSKKTIDTEIWTGTK